MGSSPSHCLVLRGHAAPAPGETPALPQGEHLLFTQGFGLSLLFCLTAAGRPELVPWAPLLPPSWWPCFPGACGGLSARTMPPVPTAPNQGSLGGGGPGAHSTWVCPCRVCLAALAPAPPSLQRLLPSLGGQSRVPAPCCAPCPAWRPSGSLGVSHLEAASDPECSVARSWRVSRASSGSLMLAVGRVRGDRPAVLHSGARILCSFKPQALQGRTSLRMFGPFWKQLLLRGEASALGRERM